MKRKVTGANKGQHVKKKDFKANAPSFRCPTRSSVNFVIFQGF